MSQPMSVPPTGLPVGVETGPLGKRFVAQLIDLVPPALIAVLASALTDGGFGAGSLFAAALILAWFLVVWAMFATRAAGPGMRAMKLQLVGLRNGRPIGWGRFLGRSLVLALLSVTVVGLVIMLVQLAGHRRKQGWHDLAVGSVVIKRRALAPRRSLAAAEPAAHGSAPVQPATAAGTPRHAAAPFPSGAPAGAPTAEPLESPSGTADSVRLRPGHVPAGQAASTQVMGSLPSDGRPEDDAWVAVLDDGREIGISGLVLLGRNPQARPGEDDAELVKVADETRTVSKTHLALSVDSSGLYVMDRGSTNGTTLTDTAGNSKPCLAGQVLPVSGGIVSFGDHWLRIERRPRR
jgi:uncharacterized RDD family membrane protein YckC